MLGLGLLLVASAVLLIAAGATTALLRPDSPIDAAVTLGVVAAAGVAASLLACGATGHLRAGPVLGMEALWALGAVMLSARAGLTPPRRLLRRPSLPEPGWELVVVALAVAALGWQLLVALVLPPFAYDALTYHLTTVATWLQNGNLDPTPLSLCCARYPEQRRADVRLAGAVPRPRRARGHRPDAFAVLGALAVAGVARSAGLGAWGSAAAGGLFLVTPAVLTQAPTNFADVVVAACALAALHALVRFAATRAPQRLVVAGLAAGLLLGMKGTGVVWAAALVLTGFVLAWWSQRSGRLSRRAAAGAIAGFLAATLALGTYWYARNWIDTGNPAYPFRVQVAGVRVFDGPFRASEVMTPPPVAADAPWPVQVVRSWAHDLAFWQVGSYDYQQRIGGLGPLWAWLGLPLLIPLAVALARRRDPALIALACMALVFLLQPYQWWARFTIPVAAAGAIAIVWAAAHAARPWLRHAVRAAALALALVGAALASFEVDPAARAQSLRAGELVGLIGAQPARRTVGRLFFPEYRFLEHVPENATVVVDLRARPVRFVYPLFGPRHTRRVLRAGATPPPRDAWVVTAAGRPLDRRLRADGRFSLEAAVRGIRVYGPT